MKGLCPFHDERSPSFHVRPQVGFYHCFGCGEGGDVFTFLQKMDHVTFQEAVERLAGRLGYELHYEDGGATPDHGNRARILAANAAAETFFVEQLATKEAEPGRAFLGERGFDPAAAARFGVGFAPEVVLRARHPPQVQGLHRGGAAGRRAAQPGRPRRLRPVPRPPDLAHPRRHRPDRRLRRAQAARRRPGPQVPEHPRDRGVPQEPGALRARPRPQRHRPRPPGRHRRGLHGCDGLPPLRRHHRGRHLRHRVRRRPHQDDPPGARRRRQREHRRHRRGHLHLRPG